MRAWSGNLSWQYVNSMTWIVSVREGAIGVCVWFGALIMQKDVWPYDHVQRAVSGC